MPRLRLAKIRHMALALHERIALAAIQVGFICGASPQPTIPDLKTHHAAARPWTKLQVDGPETFHFAVVTDRHGRPRDGVFQHAMTRLNLLRPAFVVTVGDLIGGYTRSRVELNPQWDALQKIVGELDMPFFYVAGNHDYTNVTMAEIWEEQFGATYYHFLYQDTLFIVMNSEFFDLTQSPWWKDRRPFPFAKQQAAQLRYVQDVLKSHPQVRWTFLFLHQPFWRHPWAKPASKKSAPTTGPWPKHEYIPEDWPKVESMMADRNYTIFAGHHHTYDYSATSTAHLTHEKIALATTGGGSRLRGLAYGEFDHVAWVTMTKDGPVIANILLDGVVDKALKTEKQRPHWID